MLSLFFMLLSVVIAGLSCLLVSTDCYYAQEGRCSFTPTRCVGFHLPVDTGCYFVNSLQTAPNVALVDCLGIVISVTLLITLIVGFLVRFCRRCPVKVHVDFPWDDDKDDDCDKDDDVDEDHKPKGGKGVHVKVPAKVNAPMATRSQILRGRQ